MGYTEAAKQLPRAIGTDLRAPWPASHNQGANSPAPGSVCWERDSAEGTSTRTAVPSPGTGAGVGLARRDDFEGRTANCQGASVSCSLSLWHVYETRVKMGNLTAHEEDTNGRSKLTSKNSLEKYCRSFLNLSDEEPKGSYVHKGEKCLKTSFRSLSQSPQPPACFSPSSPLHPHSKHVDPLAGGLLAGAETPHRPWGGAGDARSSPSAQNYQRDEQAADGHTAGKGSS